MRYILNSAVITSPGIYSYLLCDIEKAVSFLEEPYESYIGYDETADALSEIVQKPISVNRSIIKMEMNDKALVFRLVFPQGYKRCETGDKGRLSKEFIISHCEMGILTKLVGQ